MNDFHTKKITKLYSRCGIDTISFERQCVIAYISNMNGSTELIISEYNSAV